MGKKWLLLIPLFLVIVYVSGPSPAIPHYNKDLPVVPSVANALEDFVKNGEARHRLKPDNEARIIWANDSLKKKTDYSLVYLHGFSASQEEGNPVHMDIARKFGCNLYLSRLAEHGLDSSEQLLHLTADNLWESSKQALVIGKQLGKKVILIGTSTGASLALKLAAVYPDDVAALILLSPNIAINDDKAWILSKPWGLQLARLVKHSKYNTAEDDRPVYKKYWSKPYRLEAAVALQELLETSMNEETFKAIKQPTLVLYYYKDDVHQDSVVKVSAELSMFEELGTASGLKRKKAMPNTGNHVLGSWIKSKDTEGVEREIEKFMIEVLGMKLAWSGFHLNPRAITNSPGTS